MTLTASTASPPINYVAGGHTYTWFFGDVDSPTYAVHWAAEEEFGLEPYFQQSAQYRSRPIKSSVAASAASSPKEQKQNDRGCKPRSINSIKP